MVSTIASRPGGDPPLGDRRRHRGQRRGRAGRCPTGACVAGPRSAVALRCMMLVLSDVVRQRLTRVRHD